MQLLIVNPNTSEGVTARIRAAANAVAQPGDTIVTVSAVSGPRLIVTEADAVEATAGVLTAVERHAEPVDGIVLASFGDTGAEAVRLAHPTIPVIGIAQAACLAAQDIGGPFSIVTFTSDMMPSLKQMTIKNGAAKDLLEIASVAAPLRHDAADVVDVLSDELLSLCLECAARGANSIVLGGGPLAGLAARIQNACPVPVVDGTQAAVQHLRQHSVTLRLP
ncbi:MAG: aspartate/glutamate racemase family protein [Pseudomonadota bacterium]